MKTSKNSNSRKNPQNINILLFFMIFPLSIHAQTNWTSQVSTHALRAVFFIDNQKGWAVGEEGAIIHSIDGGDTWQEQSSGTNIDLKDVVFTDQNTGWVVGEEGLILHTTNGGSNWSVKPSGKGIEYEIFSIYLANSTTGWCTAANMNTMESDILKTSNGGDSWSNQQTVSAWLESVFFVDENKGWIAGVDYINGEDIIFHTENGGTNWTAQDVPESANHHLYDIFFINENTGWAVGYGGAILHTSDGGVTWTQQNSGTLNSLTKVLFIDDQKGWIVGGGGTILYTENGGNTWTTQSSGTNNFIFDIVFSGSGIGWAVGNNIILKNQGSSGLAEIIMKKQYKLYPNPVSKCLYIESNSDENFNVKIHSQTGKLIWSGSKISGNYMFNLENYPSEVYIIHLSTKHSNSSFKIRKY